MPKEGLEELAGWLHDDGKMEVAKTVYEIFEQAGLMVISKSIQNGLIVMVLTLNCPPTGGHPNIRLSNLCKPKDHKKHS